MRILGAGLVLTLCLLVGTAFGQGGTIPHPVELTWHQPVANRVWLTLDDTLPRRFAAVGEGAGGTAAPGASLQTEDWKTRPYLADRGDGIHTSLFGTYVRKKELLIYSFYEYTRNRDAEYNPRELGFGLDQEFKGKRTTHEALLFAAYGITDRLAVEFESALYSTATQAKSSSDPSAMPNSLHESGPGDTEGQIRYRIVEETETRPEIISFAKVVFPLQRSKRLIGAQHWEAGLGVNVSKGFSWGTLMLKASAEYSGEGGGTVDFGEYGIEYVKRLNDRWRLVLAVEGVQYDEVQAIVELQWKLTPHITLKVNSGFGLTPKAEEFAPEIGLLFSF